jgi:hypothetical protein
MKEKISRQKVFGIGLSRTRTTGPTVALRSLGLKSIHYPRDDTTQRELMAYYAGQDSFYFTAAEEFDALRGAPIASVYRELAGGTHSSPYFVLAVREKTSWLESRARLFAEPFPREQCVAI